MRRLRYSAAARDDLGHIALYIARESGSRAVAEAFVAKLHGRCEQLASLPGIMGQARPELRADIRSTPHQNYVIFFRYVEEVVEVVNVLNASRDVDRYFG